MKQREQTSVEKTLSAVWAAVYQARAEELQKEYLQVFDSATIVTGPVSALTFRGHRLRSPNPPNFDRVVKMPDELDERMTKYLIDQQALDLDINNFKQCFGTILALEAAPEEKRNYWPDTLVNVMLPTYPDSYLKFERTTPIEEMPYPSKFLRKNYLEHVVPRIDYYLALKLLM